MTSDVRDVRAYVRAYVRAETLVAVDVCGTCGQFPSCGRAHDAGRLRSVRFGAVRSRTYVCPHVPHTSTAATLSGDSMPAHRAAHSAHAFARAFFSAYGLLKKMEKEGLAA